LLPGAALSHQKEFYYLEVLNKIYL